MCSKKVQALNEENVLKIVNYLILRGACLCLSLIAQSCTTLYNLLDCSPPGSYIHGIFQARILEWVAISFSSGSSQSRD